MAVQNLPSSAGGGKGGPCEHYHCAAQPDGALAKTNWVGNHSFLQKVVEHCVLNGRVNSIRGAGSGQGTNSTRRLADLADRKLNFRPKPCRNPPKGFEIRHPMIWRYRAKPPKIGKIDFPAETGG